MKRVLGLSILVAICNACGGSSSPLAPSRQPVTESAATSGFSIVVGSPPTGVPAVNLTECLHPSSAQACFPPLPVRPRGATASFLSAPINLNASASGSSVTLTWVASGLVDAYVIEAGSSSGLANLANFSTGNALTTFQASGIGAGTYYVRVRAISSGGISVPSNEAVLIVGGGPCVAPGAPSGLSVVSLLGSTIVLSWGASAGNPTSYVVEAGSLSGLSNLANSDLGSAGTSLTATGLGNGTYYVRIRAKNGCGASGPSNEIILTVGSTPTPTSCGAAPAAPAGLSVSVSGTSVSLTWGTPSGLPTSYIVEIGTASGLANVASTEVGSASHSRTLTPGSYFARVKAKNACGTSAASNEGSFTISPPFTGTWRGQVRSSSCSGDGVFATFCAANPGLSDALVLVLNQSGSNVSGTIDVGGGVASASGTAQGNSLSISGTFQSQGVITSYESWDTSLSGSSMVGGFTVRFSLSSASGSVRYPVALAGVSRASSLTFLHFAVSEGMDNRLAALAERVSAALRSSR